MSLPKRTWVIPDEASHGDAQSHKPRLVVLPSSTAGAGTRRESTTTWRAAVSVVLCYVLGPLAVFISPRVQFRGRRMSALAVTLSGGLVLWQWPAFQEGMGQGPGPMIVIGAVLHFLAILGFIIWSGVIRDVAETNGPRLLCSLPSPLQGSVTLLILGLLLPGMGLVLVGRSARARGALWALFLTGGCALTAMHAPDLWNRHLAMGWSARSSLGVEMVFLLWAAAGILGVLIWMIQALDGMRLQSRAETRSSSRGDWTGGLLLLAMAAMLATTRPALFAQDLDHLARAARNEELVLIPAGLTLWAVKLDPSRPLYVWHLATLYQDLGMTDRASRLRRSLEERWALYEAARRESPPDSY